MDAIKKLLKDLDFKENEADIIIEPTNEFYNYEIFYFGKEREKLITKKYDKF